MKLLHIVGDSCFGGAARIILALGQMARADGWEVDVLTTDPVFQRAVRRHGLGCVNLDVIRREIHPLWDLTGLLRLARFLRRESYQIVHTHTSKGGFVGRLAASMARVPVIVHTMHGLAFHESSSTRVRVFYSALERIAATQCDRIVSVSEFHRNWALDLRICRSFQIVAIPNGVVDMKRPEVPAAQVRRRLGIENTDLMLLTMARLAQDKGLEYLVEAAALLPCQPRFRVIIAGEGPQRTDLAGLAEKLDVTDRVRFLGYRQDVSDLLAASDVVVLPSLREGLSIALLEAMSAGKPIVATRIGSHVEVASRGNIARLVTPADSYALCEAITMLARDKALRRQLGAGARALFESCYTEDRMVKSYHQVYVELAQKKCLSRAAQKKAVLESPDCINQAQTAAASGRESVRGHS